MKSKVGFRKGGGSGNKISVKIVEKYIAKRILCKSLMDQEKASDKVDWNALGKIIQIYGMGGKLLGATKLLQK